MDALKAALGKKLEEQVWLEEGEGEEGEASSSRLTKRTIHPTHQASKVLGDVLGKVSGGSIKLPGALSEVRIHRKNAPPRCHFRVTAPAPRRLCLSVRGWLLDFNWEGCETKHCLYLSAYSPFHSLTHAV